MIHLPLKNNIYLVFFSLEVQRRLIQTRLYQKSFYSDLKETNHKPSKVSPRKKSPNTEFFLVRIFPCSD